MRFDVVYLYASICGEQHQSAARATASEVTEIMMTHTFGPIRLTHRLLEDLNASGRTLGFMSSIEAA